MVTSVVHTSMLGIKDCLEVKNNISAIIKTGHQIYLGVDGNMKEPKIVSNETVSVNKLGNFPKNSRILKFFVISNENKKCFELMNGPKDKCPSGDPFPLAN